MFMGITQIPRGACLTDSVSAGQPLFNKNVYCLRDLNVDGCKTQISLQWQLPFNT